jgi:hypothetical protein
MASPNISAGDIWRVNVLGVSGDQQVQNHFWYVGSAGPGPEPIDTWALAFRAGWRTLAANLGTSYSVRRYDFQILAGISLQPVTNSIRYHWAGYFALWGNSSDSGTTSGEEVPLTDCATVQETFVGDPNLSTLYFPGSPAPIPPVGFFEKRSRGETRLGPLPFSALTSSAPEQLTPTYAASIEAQYNTLFPLSGITVVGNLVIESQNNKDWPTHRSDVNGPHLAFQPVSAIHCELLLGTQATRKERRARY